MIEILESQTVNVILLSTILGLCPLGRAEYFSGRYQGESNNICKNLNLLQMGV